MILDLNVIQTEPGAGEAHPFAPPAGFGGSSEDYLKLMRRRYKEEFHPFGQRMVTAARFAVAHSQRFTGPFAREAQRVIDGLKANLDKGGRGA